MTSARTDESTPDDKTLVQSDDLAARSVELSHARQQVPAEVPGHAVLTCLGEGSYGSVWLAREHSTGKSVAVKFYAHHRGLDWTLLSREVEKLAVLYTSRNIVGLIDVGWESDPPYYTMEYLENGSLAGFLAHGPLPTQEAARIARSVANALVHAHGSGILHCDLKPANVLLDGDFEPRLCDFGQSRLSDEQDPALGTLFYMAPEQADLNAVPDARWDVYALGALLYQMLCGEVPYRTEEAERQMRSAETLEERLTVYRQLLLRLPKPDAHRKVRGVDRRLAEIVDRCLEIDPQKRLANAQVVLDMMDSRDRHRSRRPLLALGVLGPALLLAAILPLGGNAMRDAVGKAQSNQVDLALASDVETANILAEIVDRELQRRQEELVKVADDPELQQLVELQSERPLEKRKELFKFLKDEKARVDGERQSLSLEPDTSWFLTDAQGNQLFRQPFNEDTIDKNFASRDYFHGLGKEFDRNDIPRGITPIRAPYVSTAFRSNATQRYMVAISVPVWDQDRRRVIGLLARTIHLDDLRKEFGSNIRGQTSGEVNRVIVLVDRRDGRLLAHPWMTQQHLEGLPADQFNKLTLPREQSAVSGILEELHEVRGPLRIVDETYEDPVGRIDAGIRPSAADYRGRWLAAFCPIGETQDAKRGWIAVVQERRDVALAPVEAIRSTMLRYAAWAVFIGCTLLAILWFFVAMALNRRSNGGWGRLAGTAQTPNSMTTVAERLSESGRHTVTRQEAPRD